MRVEKAEGNQPRAQTGKNHAHSLASEQRDWTAWIYRLQGLLTTDSTLSFRVAIILLLLFIVGAAGTTLYLGPPPIAHYGHDIPVFLDGAWRVYQGQRPHVDFFTTLGPCFFIILALGMIVVGPTAHALVAASASMCVLLTIWAWLIARHRLPPILALYFSMLVGLMVIGTYSLGCPSHIVSYALLYNRFCQAMLGILMVESLTPPRTQSPRVPFLGGLSSGALLVLLFFTKFSFLSAGGILLLASPLLVGLGKQRLAGLIAGVVLIAAPMLIYLRGDIAAILADIRSTTLVYGSAALEPSLLSERLVPSLKDLVCLPLLWLIYRYSPAAALSQGVSDVKMGVIVAAITAVACLSLATSFGGGDCAPAFFGAVIILELFERKTATKPTEQDIVSSATEQMSREEDKASQLRRVATYFLAGFLIIPLAVKQVESIRFGRVLRQSLGSIPPPRMLIDADPLRDLLILRPGGEASYDLLYSAKLNDGFALLRQIVTPEDRISVIDFCNPFSFGLQQKSAVGDSVSYHFERNFNREHHWPAETLFRDVSILMYSKETDSESSTPMEGIYCDYITANFDQALVSARWVLYTRKGRAGPSVNTNSAELR